MKVNYVLMYGTPYLKYREFENFEDISKFLINKRIVNYSIFKKLEDKEEVEMIYRDSDIHYLENIIKEVREKINNFDVFKEFTFPLMKREEENQVKSSIDYEWRKSIKEPLLKILDKVGVDKE